MQLHWYYMRLLLTTIIAAAAVTLSKSHKTFYQQHKKNAVLCMQNFQAHDDKDWVIAIQKPCRAIWMSVCIFLCEYKVHILLRPCCTDLRIERVCNDTVGKQRAREYYIDDIRTLVHAIQITVWLHFIFILSLERRNKIIQHIWICDFFRFLLFVL